jgi:Mor family transcriptional regulator
MNLIQSTPRHDLADPDLVDRIFAYILADPAMAKAVQVMTTTTKDAPKNDQGMEDPITRIKASVRAEFAGSAFYVAERPATVRQQQVAEVLALFNGRNTTEVARTLGISRRSVYRYIKQAGKATATTSAQGQRNKPRAKQ